MYKQVCGAIVFIYACAAHAQSSITLFGVIDDGITYVSNVGGKRVFELQDGVSQLSKFGLKGAEDFGGGWKSIFELDSAFSPNSGAVIPAGSIFGFRSSVGVENDKYGSLTFGRNFDQMTEILLPFHSGFSTIGIYNLNPGDQDRISGEWLNNLVTYASPNIDGLKFAAQYSFNSQSSSYENYGNAYSFGASYSSGSFNIGAATTGIHDYYFSPGSSLGVSSFFGQPLASDDASVFMKNFRTAGVGLGWNFQTVYLSGVYSNTRFDNGIDAETLQSINASLRYYISAELTTAAGYTYSKLGGSKWNEFGVTVDYNVSKRTDVYASANYEKASGDDTRADFVYIGPSGNDKQLALRVGMRHRF
jgi:outer membrane protein OmpU